MTGALRIFSFKLWSLGAKIKGKFIALETSASLKKSYFTRLMLWRFIIHNKNREGKNMLRVNKRVKGSLCLSFHLPFAIYFILIFLSTVWCSQHKFSNWNETFTWRWWFLVNKLLFFYVTSLLSFRSVVDCSVFNNFFPFACGLFANCAQRNLSCGMLFCFAG